MCNRTYGKYQLQSVCSDTCNFNIASVDRAPSERIASVKNLAVTTAACGQRIAKAAEKLTANPMVVIFKTKSFLWITNIVGLAALFLLRLRKNRFKIQFQSITTLTL